MSPTRFRCANSLAPPGGRRDSVGLAPLGLAAGKVALQPAPVAQLAARRSHNPKVASSILVWGRAIYFLILF